MFTNLRCVWLLATLLAVCVVPSAQAAIIFNNFGPGDTFSFVGRILQGPDVGTIADVNQAAAFTVGPTDFLLTSVSLGINADDPGPLDVIVAVDNAGLPGATLRTLPINVNAIGDQVITVADNGTETLEANTTYWIVADAEGSFDGAWRFNSIGDVGPTAGQTEGFPWNLHVKGDRYAMRVEGRVVPEPAAFLLTLIAAGLLLIRRKVS